MSRELSLEINKLCNFRCTFCYTEKHREDFPDIERVLALIEEGIGMGVSSLSLTGGEPLLQWDRVATIARFARSRDLRTRLNTNGVLLAPGERTDELSSLIDEFQVSCNATSDERFAAYSQVKPATRPFSTLLENVRHLLAKGAQVTIRFTLDERTAPDLRPVFEHFCGRHERLGSRSVSRFKVRIVVPAGPIRASRDAFGVIRRAAEDLFQLARDTPEAQVQFKDGSGLVEAPADLPNLSSPPCICGERSIHVSSDLRRVTPCVFVRDVHDLSSGNLRDGDDTLADVWQRVREGRFAAAARGTDLCTGHSSWDPSAGLKKGGAGSREHAGGLKVLDLRAGIRA